MALSTHCPLVAASGITCLGGGLPIISGLFSFFRANGEFRLNPRGNSKAILYPSAKEAKRLKSLIVSPGW